MADQHKVVDLSGYALSCRNCNLSEICLPGGTEEAALDGVETILSGPIRLRRGDHLYRVGDRLKSLYAVKAGAIKAFCPTANGDEQIVGFHMPGELVGLDALDTEAHCCTAVAVENSTVCGFSVTELEELCREQPETRRQLNRLMGKQVSNTHQMLVLLGKKSAEGRLATFLIALSDRLRERGFSALEFNLSMPRNDIANYLGLAVETVSRVFSRFQEEGLLTVQSRHVRIRNLARLVELTGTASRSSPSFRPGAPRIGRVVNMVRESAASLPAASS